MPDRRYFEKLVRDTGFRLDVLEKTYHLIKILQHIFSQPSIGDNLTLKGGTALNFIYLDIPRLSIDIDFNLTDVVSDMEVKQKVEDIFHRINRIGTNLGYRVEDATSSVIWQRKIVRYQTLHGHADFIKIEIDKIERIPLMERTKKIISIPFPEISSFSVFTYNIQELIAMKIKALYDRGHPRDLFDLYKLSRAVFESAGLIDLVVVYSCFTIQGFGLPELIEKTDAIIEDDFTQEVIPFLRSTEIIDLHIVKSAVIDFLKRIYSEEDDRHRQFLGAFRAGKLRLDLLREELRNKVQIHPSITFWLQAR